MTYQAIANGARGVNYFGGHLTQVATPEDAAAGWNWSFWQQVLRPIVRSSRPRELQPALVAPDASPGVKTQTPRSSSSPAARRLPVRDRREARRQVSRVAFTGLPKRRDGSALTAGRVLFEYEQRPLPPPVQHAPRRIGRSLSGWAIRGLVRPHDAHVYRFAL